MAGADPAAGFRIEELRAEASFCIRTEPRPRKMLPFVVPALLFGGTTVAGTSNLAFSMAGEPKSLP